MKLNDEQKALVNQYGHLFANTGGNPIIELVERTDVDAFNNFVAASLQIACDSQIVLLQRLKAAGLLSAPASAN